MYKVYIKVDNMAFLLPINPDEVKFVYETSINRYEIIGLGEIAEFSSNKLISTELKSFIPSENTNLITNSTIDAKTFVNAINDARAVGEVIELIIRRDTLDNIDLNCYVSTFNVIEKGGEVGDIYYELSLLQWRPHEPQIVEIQQPAPIKISVPIQQTGSQYIAQVSGMTNTEVKETKEVVVKEEEKPTTTSEIVQGDSVIINGKGYNTAGGFLNLHKVFNNTNGVVDSILTNKAYPYRVKFKGMSAKSDYISISYYFKKESLTKASGGTR